MRTTLSTSITYGLHNIPVRVCNMVKDVGSSSKLQQTCPKCNEHVGKPNECKGCKNRPKNNEMGKRYIIDKQHKINLTKEQMQSIKDADKSITVKGTIPKDSLDLRKVIGGYYILPDEKIKKLWKILYNALQGDKFIVVTYSLGRRKIGVLRSQEDAIILHTIAYEDNFTQLDEEVNNIQVTPEENKMGEDFINSLKTIELSAITDTYEEKLAELIEKVDNGEEITVQVQQPQEEDLGFFKTK